MVIRLSPTLQKRVEREAKARGVKPSRLVADALKKYFAPPSDPVSEARKQLRELLKYKKPVADFDAAVEQAKKEAGRLIEDNQDWIDSVMSRGRQHSEAEH